jgi:hypothetical protein
MNDVACPSIFKYGLIKKIFNSGLNCVPSNSETVSAFANDFFLIVFMPDDPKNFVK